MSNELQKIESFRYALAIAETYEEINKIESAAAAMAEFARCSNISFERQNDLGKFRIEIELKKGTWLKKHFPHGSSKENPRHKSFKVDDINLKKMPANKNESSRARLICETESKIIESVQTEIIEKGDVITPAKVEREIRKVEREKRNNEMESEPLPIGKYQVIYADPPKELYKKNSEVL